MSPNQASRKALVCVFRDMSLSRMPRASFVDARGLLGPRRDAIEFFTPKAAKEWAAGHLKLTEVAIEYVRRQPKKKRPFLAMDGAK